MASHQGVLTLALAVVLLALPSLTYGVTLYVRPTSTNTSCPTYPCHTLSEYAQDLSQYFNESNLTLLLLPGNHTLDLNMTITSIQQLEIFGNYSAVVPTRIICSSNVAIGFAFRYISNMIIDGLTFSSCARSHVVPVRNGDASFTTNNGLYLQSIQTAEIIDCSFQDSYGSALGVEDSHVVLRGNNNFLNNCRLYSYRDSRYGGGIFVHSSNLSLTGSIRLIGNRAYSGGGIYAMVNSNVTISGNTTFIGNSAFHGGGVYAKFSSRVDISGNTTFINNSASYGGGIYAELNSSVDISENVTFITNSARFGGGISAWSNSRVDISGDTTFISNSAHGEHNLYYITPAFSGGGVCASTNSSVYISGNTIFIGNSADTGGGIYAEFDSNVSISGNTIFSTSTAIHGGGGISAVTGSNINITGNTLFRSNSAGVGGCIFVQMDTRRSLGDVLRHLHYSSHATFLNLDGNGTFTNCSATNNGGAIYVRETHVNFGGTNVFRANRAQFGGGLYGDKSSLNLPGDNAFTANMAGSRGGGIYVQNTSMSIDGTVLLSDNGAKLDGGGMYATSSNLNFSGNITIRSNTAQKGAGVYSDNSTFSIHKYNYVQKNVALYYGGGAFVTRTLLIVAGINTFMANSAGEGGGIYATANSILNMNGVNTFIANRAHTNGGGIWLNNSKLASSGSNHFAKCTASYDGGAVYTYASAARLTGNTIFEFNLATNGGGIHARWSNVSVTNGTNFKFNNAVLGGGIFIANSTFEFNDSSNFKGNQANRTGGGIYAARSVLNFLGTSSITENHAARDGGGIYTKEDCIVNLLGLTNYQNNSAGDTGGGISAFRSSFSLAGNNNFDSNKAVKGAGFYASNCSVNLSGENTFIDNVAQLDGGAIYADSSNLNLSGNVAIRNNTAQLGGGVYSDNNILNVDGHNVLEQNVATYYGGGIYTRRTLCVHAGNNTYIANSAGVGGGIYGTANSTLIMTGSNLFMANTAHVSGGGVWVDYTNLTLNGFNQFVDCVASYEGGAIFIYAATASLSGNNTFESNSATTGGGIHARWSSVRVTNSCNLKQNIAVFGGGIYTDNSTFEFNGSSTFSSNHANHTGGGIYAARSVLNFNGTSSITANYAARDGGGIYTRDECVVNLIGYGNYQNNSAEDTGGGISAFRSNFHLVGNNNFDHNQAMEGGGFYAFHCTVNYLGENTFTSNSATNHGGGFTVLHSTIHLNGSTTFRKNSAVRGGGMYISASTTDTGGSNCFMNNIAKSEGGGIYARDSTVQFNGKDVFMANTARSRGAAIHTSFSTFIFQGSSSFMNNLAKYGGGVYSESSNLTFSLHVSSHQTRTLPLSINCNICSDVFNQSTIPEICFLNNKALRGGAHYFDLYSNFSLHQTTQIHYQDNYAIEFGGAIYVVDVPGHGQFLYDTQYYAPFRTECFFHILGNEQSLDLNTSPLLFVNNSAGMRGSVLYGGLLDKCTFTSNIHKNVLELFNMSIVKRKNVMGYSISSDPTQLCFCNMSKLSCTEVMQSRSIYPGQSVGVSVVSIDQSGSAIPTLIHTKIHSGQNLNVPETISYETGGTCTSRNYSVTPKNSFNQLEFYPSNRSGDTIHLILNIKFEKCPIGFEQSNFTSECICDHRLWQYTNSCSIDKQAILRNASRTFWIGVLYNNGTPEGFIHHRYCPLDYCTSESKYINLNNPDEQCNYNHSGLLCGQCRKGLSLVLGSSQCKRCSNNYLALLIPLALTGVLLVLLLFLLHLTVAEGTLHGLIFYANIVAANHHIFLHQSSNDPASIFIAWLNLDLGIQTCFYSGIDAYAKTWLDLVFPVYIWVIVGFLVYISHHSVTVTKLLGSSPVPVLATLFLLSYAKVLRTIIAALSLTILHYPDKDVVVWIHDANVPLAKYIPLVVVALLFLLFLFLPYTLLLLLSQWLQSKSHFCLLSWVRNPKLKAILDTYHAPYKLKHRYWTGLLLLLRCALLLVFAFNIGGDDSVNLLVICSTAFGIFVWFSLSGMVYKSWYLNALELSFILNLGMLAVATYHVNQSGGSQAAVAYTSVGIAFLTFVGIIIYHSYIRIKSKVQYIQRGQQLLFSNYYGNCEDNGKKDSLEHKCEVTPTIITHTEVDLRELRSPLNLLDTK